MSAAPIPAECRARTAARAPRSDAASSGAANRRASIRVLRATQAGSASGTRVASSALVTSRDGRYDPVPRMPTVMVAPMLFAPKIGSPDGAGAGSAGSSLVKAANPAREVLRAHRPFRDRSTVPPETDEPSQMLPAFLGDLGV